MDRLLKDNLETLVGRKHNYYLDMWERYEKSESFKGWNCSALFFGFIWVAYRKMYELAAKLFGLQILLAVVGVMPRILAALGLPLPWYLAYPVIASTSIVIFGINIYCGFFGNKLYEEKTKRLLEEINDMKIEDKWKLNDLLEEKGGVGVEIVILCVIACGLVLFINVI